MELVQQYKKLHKIDHLHYITMESVIHRVTGNFKGKPMDGMNMHNIKFDLEVEMTTRGLKKFFQLELSKKYNGVNIKVHEINRFNPPKECVVWS